MSATLLSLGLEHQFMKLAMIAGVLVAISSALVGVMVVQRGLSFAGVGLSHGAFGGVALGLLLDVEPMLIALPFVFVLAALLAPFHRSRSIKPDTIVGVVFSFSMALGVVFLFLRESGSVDAFGYLFGSILSVSQLDCVIAAGVLAACGLMFKYWGSWAYQSFDPELAEADQGQPLSRDMIFMFLVALVIAASIKLVGMVLLSAMLIVPAAAARLVSRTMRGMTLSAIALSLVSVVVGLIASYRLDLPSGATIVLLQCMTFGAALMIHYGVNRAR